MKKCSNLILSMFHAVR